MSAKKSFFTKSKKCSFLLFLLGFTVILTFSSPLCAESNAHPVLYDFQENLSQAEASVRVASGLEKGIWESIHFWFPSAAEISRIETLMKEEVIEFISFKIQSDMIYRLTFNDISPQGKIVLRYNKGILDEKMKKHKLDMRIRVKSGRKTLADVREYDLQELEQAKIKLGVPAFLQRKMPITFEVTSLGNHPEESLVLLNARLLKS